MKSVRLEAELQARLREAAEVAGVSESELMRSAVSARVNAILGDRLDRRLVGSIGRVHGGGGRARHAHQAAAELIRKRSGRAPARQS